MPVSLLQFSLRILRGNAAQRIIVFWALATGFFLMPTATRASDTSTLDPWLQKAHAQDLAHQPMWQLLLHYKPDKWGDVRSQTDDPRFFLSPQGAQQPEAELAAAVAALFSQELSESHIRCRFPARAEWLIERLAIDGKTLPQPECKEKNAFIASVNPAGATLVFPVAYMNSPSSMFGHTFLRIDQIGQTEESRLLAWTINYAADANNDDSEIVFAWKGLFGGYPGQFSVLPYYKKVKEYSDWESRNVWEFPLNLTQEETRRMVLHAWELKEIRFDYYFLKENCSYRVLELLDVARPGVDLQTRFFSNAIPVDTVRAIQDAGLVMDASFRPSAMTLVKNGLAQLNEDEQALVLDLALAAKNSDDWVNALSHLKELPVKRQQMTLETAYEYLRLKVNMDKLGRDGTAERSLWLLKQRSALPAGSPLTAATPPSVRDDQAHPSKRLKIGLGEHQNAAYLDIRWRPAFHELTDPLAGFPAGAQINFLDLHFRLWQEEVRPATQLERVDVISITTLTPQDAFFQPWSWQVNIGARREAADKPSLDRPMVGHFDVSFGVTKAVTTSVSAFLLAGGALEAGQSLARGHDAGPLADMGIFGHHRWGQWRATARRIEWTASDQPAATTAEFIHTFNLDRDLALEARAARLERWDEWHTDASLGVLWFY